MSAPMLLSQPSTAVNPGPPSGPSADQLSCATRTAIDELVIPVYASEAPK